MQRPRNYYRLDYEQRREIDRHISDFKDLEYEKRRADENAEWAQVEADKMRREFARAREGWREECGRIDDTLREAQAELAEVARQRDTLLAALETALPHLHWASCSGSRCNEVIAKAQAAIAIAKAKEKESDAQPSHG